MSKKKKSREKTLSSTALSPEQETKLSSLLADYKDTDPRQIVKEIPSPFIAKVFIEKLPPEGSDLVQLILAVMDTFPQKEVQKAARKLLFKLKTKGIEVPDIKKGDVQTPIIKPIAQENPEALLGSFDPAGTRGVMVALPRFPKGFDVGIGVISERQGILEFFYGTYSKKGFKEMKKALLESDDMIMVKTSLAHAATAIEKAYAVNQDSGTEAARAYAEFRSTLLNKTDLLERSPIYELISETEIDTSLVTQSNLDKLFVHPLMKLLIINHEKLSDLMDEISALDDSPIYLTEEQKSVRREEIQQKWLANNMTFEERQTLRYRLEEMAYILWNKEDQELARIAVVAAKEIVGEKNIVLDYLFTRTLSLALGEPQDTEGDTEEDAGSLIINP